MRATAFTSSPKTFTFCIAVRGGGGGGGGGGGVAAGHDTSQPDGQQVEGYDDPVREGVARALHAEEGAEEVSEAGRVHEDGPERRRGEGFVGEGVGVDGAEGGGLVVLVQRVC